MYLRTNGIHIDRRVQEKHMELDEKLVPTKSVLSNSRMCVKYPPLVI